MSTKVLAYTVSHGDRPFLERCVREMRGSSGMWFDWLVCLGAPSQRLSREAQRLLDDPDGHGIQYLVQWPENRGQHHATKAALDYARKHGYAWLLRIDDDVQFKTRRWLKKMIERTTELRGLIQAGLSEKEHAPDFVVSPTVLGLRHPVQSIGVLDKGQSFDVEVIPMAGGACRLMPMSLLRGYEAPIYAPMRRGDPQSIAEHAARRGAYHIRFRDVRVIHDTREIEKALGPSLEQDMAGWWPFLECADV